MQKKRAAWFCLHAPLLPAACSRRTAYVRTVAPWVPGSSLLWGGREPFTKGPKNTQRTSTWPGAGKRNSNSKERDKEKKDLVLWEQQALASLVLGCETTSADELGRRFSSFLPPAARSPCPPWALLPLCPFAQPCRRADGALLPQHPEAAQGAMDPTSAGARNG